MAKINQPAREGQEKEFELSADYVFLWAYYELKSILDSAYHTYFLERYLSAEEKLTARTCEELILTTLQMNLRLRADNKVWRHENGKTYIYRGEEKESEVGFLDGFDPDGLNELDDAGLEKLRAAITDWIEKARYEDKKELVTHLYRAFKDKFWFFVILPYNSKTDYIEAWLPPDDWEKTYPGIISPVKDARRFLSRYKNPLGIGTSSAVILTGQPEELPNELDDPRGEWRTTDIALCKRACIHLPMSVPAEDESSGATGQKIALGTFGIYSYFKEAFTKIWESRQEEIKRVIHDTSRLLFYADSAEVRNQFFRIYYSVRSKETLEDKAELFDEGFVRNDKLLGSQICATYTELAPHLLECVDVEISADAVHTYFTSLFADTQFYTIKKDGQADYELRADGNVLSNGKIKEFLKSFSHVVFGKSSPDRTRSFTGNNFNCYAITRDNETSPTQIIESLSSEDEFNDELFRSLLALAIEKEMGSSYRSMSLNEEWEERYHEISKGDIPFNWRENTSHDEIWNFNLIQNIPWLEKCEGFLKGKMEAKKEDYEEGIMGRGGVSKEALKDGREAFEFHKKLDGVLSTIEKLELERTLLKAIYREKSLHCTENIDQFLEEKANHSFEARLGLTLHPGFEQADLQKGKYDRLRKAFNALLNCEPLLLFVTRKREKHRITKFHVDCDDRKKVISALQNIRFYSQAQTLVERYLRDGGPAKFGFERYGKTHDEVIASAELSKEGSDVLMRCLDSDGSPCATAHWALREREELVGCYLQRGIEVHDDLKAPYFLNSNLVRGEAESWTPSSIDTRLPVDQVILNLLGIRSAHGEYLTFPIDSAEPLKMYSIKNTEFVITERLYKSFHAAVRNIFKGRLAKEEIDIYIKLLWKMGFGPGSRYEETALRLAKVIRKSGTDEKSSTDGKSETDKKSSTGEKSDTDKKRGTDDKIHIILHGDTGTGKEVVAKFIHQHSTRGGRHYLSYNCAAIPDTLFEALVFGYVPGAYTDAKIFSDGYFIRASEGTLFLDEIGDLSLYQQAKILKALEENSIYRLGDFVPVPIDVRIIAATNRNLKEMMDIFERGKKSENDLTPPFRSDLFHRLQYPVKLPSLTERSDVGKWLLLVNIFPEITHKAGIEAAKACQYIGTLKELISNRELTFGNIRGWISVLKYMLSFEERDLNKLKDLLEFTKVESSRSLDGQPHSDSKAMSDGALSRLQILAEEIRARKEEHGGEAYKEQLREFLKIYLESKGKRIYQIDVKSYFDDREKYVIDDLAYKKWGFLERINPKKPSKGYQKGTNLYTSD